MSPKKDDSHLPDLERLEELKRLQLTDAEIAGCLELTPERLRELRKKDPRFRAAYLRGEAKGKLELREKQFEKAMSGDAQMLKWLGKQYLNQADQAEASSGRRGSLWEAIAAGLGFSTGPTE